MQTVYSRIAATLALLAACANMCVLPAATAQTAPDATCGSTAGTCLFMPLLRRDALPVSLIEPIATLPGNATAITVSDGYAYVGLDSTLSVVDVQNPAQPRVVGRYTLPQERFGSTLTSIVQQGARLYATTRYVETSCCLSGDLLVLDVQQPSTPTLLGNVQDSGLSDVAVDGMNAFVTGIPWVSAAPVLAVYDVSNPAAPVQRSTQGNSGSSAVAVTGTTAYVTNGAGITIFDISNPVTPTLQTTTAISGVIDVAVDGTYLYAAAGAVGLVVFDISTPHAPRLVGQVATGGRATRLHVVDGRAFVAQGQDGVAVVDVTQPNNPLLLARYDTPGTASDVWVGGGVLYVADAEAGLQMLRLVP